MKIWIYNNYNTLPEHGALARAFYFGKYLKKAGHEPVVFVGSHPHNTNLQLISGKKKYLEYEKCAFPWVLVKTCNYEGSKIKRIFSMFQYYFNLQKAVRHYETPNVIIGSSAHPLAAYAAIKHAKKYHCKSVVEVRDLWPESIVAYGICSKKNLIIKLLYRFERWLYTNADSIVFTMEGGCNYIVEQGWDIGHGGSVDINKVHHINNGVDLDEFNYNAVNSDFKDEDLTNPNLFKVVYTGSIRMVNRINSLVDVALILQKKRINNIILLIWGSGDYVNEIEKAIKVNGLTNIKLKGYAAKKDIPAILKKSDLNIYMLADSPLYRFGLSMNKLFEYFASGKPILASANSEYSIIDKYECGICLNSFTPETMAEEIVHFRNLPKEKYIKYCNDAIRASKDYDFKVLVQKLIDIIK